MFIRLLHVLLLTSVSTCIYPDSSNQARYSVVRVNVQAAQNEYLRVL